MTEHSEQRTNQRSGLLVLAWIWVAAPFGYGVYELVLKVSQLFGG